MGEFEGKVVVITGSTKGIGRATAQAFAAEGARVRGMDLQGDCWFRGDVGRREDLETFARRLATEEGQVDVLVNNAPPLMRGLAECTYEEFSHALAVGVTAPFYLTQQLLPFFAPGASVINISSSRDRMSQPQTESYTAAKGGIHALTHAMAVSLAGKVRVNSISPGWIDTLSSRLSEEDLLQQPVGRVGKPEDIAALIVFLASDRAGFITGENICVDGGMTRQMIYHGEHGWMFTAQH